MFTYILVYSCEDQHEYPQISSDARYNKNLTIQALASSFFP